MYINSRNKLQKINFFVIDEGFSFCDDISLQKIPNLFNYMRKIYDFTLVVSHNEQIKMYTDIDLPIISNNGVSKVYFVGNNNKEKIKNNMKYLGKINNGNNGTDVKDAEKKKKVIAKKIVQKKINYKEKNKISHELKKSKIKAKNIINLSSDYSQDSSDSFDSSGSNTSRYSNYKKNKLKK